MTFGTVEEAPIAEGVTTATAAAQLLEALREGGVEIAFANFGSDHPAIIEALAADRERGIESPTIVLCPHEYTALSAAHGYSAATGRPSAVFVHTDVGTANLGGAVHNAARAHVPVLIFAGLTPYTLEGELPGGRNTVINDLQDVPDQHALVRPYVKWSYDLRTGTNVKQVVHRALQIAGSSPQGPVYLTGAREVLAETAPQREIRADLWRPVELQPAPQGIVTELLHLLDQAERPVVVTSYLGRRPDSVGKLVKLAEQVGFAVLEAVPEHVGFPPNHSLHVGSEPGGIVTDADLIVAIDTDSPWLPSRHTPASDTRRFFIDPDPLKLEIPLWYRPSDAFVRADSAAVLDQLLVNAGSIAFNPDRRSARLAWAHELHRLRQEQGERSLIADSADAKLTAAVVGSVLGSILPPDAILVNEAITNSEAIWRHVERTMPGTLFGNRGTSLGWSGGAALGIKAADSSRTVVTVVGDGAHQIAVPTSAHWVAQHYGLATLTVVLDNGGWGATKRNLRLQHAGGQADITDRYWVNLGQTSDLARVAEAAGGAWAAQVTQIDALESTLREALAATVAGRPAVVQVLLEPLSAQEEDRLPRVRG